MFWAIQGRIKELVVPEWKRMGLNGHHTHQDPIYIPGGFLDLCQINRHIGGQAAF